jgi:membrane protein DedA with SNARE-associated domain
VLPGGAATPSASIATVLTLAVHLHLHIHLFHHHHFRGPPIDYGALGLAAGASFAGLPGPGEPLLVAAGIFAAKHRLDLATVLFAAWAGAFTGGVIGWLVGWKAGRAVLTAPGPLLRLRQSAIARGDEVFARVPVVAIILAPAPVAGIHRVRPRLYLTVNFLSSVVWAVGIGLGAYYAGPPVLDVVGDLGWVLGGALVVLVVAVAGIALWRRRVRRGRAGPRDGSTGSSPPTTPRGTAPPAAQH